MRDVLVLLLVFCVQIYTKDLILGSRVNNTLLSRDTVVYKGIPFKTRNKDYTYTDVKQRIIKGIFARDLSHAESEVAVTSGGIGSTYVTLHFTSARWRGLKYRVLIYVEDK